MCCNKKCWLIVGSVVGGLLAILGGVLFPAGDLIIEGKINTEAVIEDGTIAYENWIKPGSPVYRYFWIFHVTNPDDVLVGGKPNLEQKGPYAYLVRHVPKSNVTQNNNNNTVSFYQPNEAIFQRHLSVGPEEDIYTVLNLAVAAAPSMFTGLEGLINGFIKASNSSLFQVRSVKELLWGYRDPFLERIPNFILQDKNTGVFYPYNGTSDGPYTVFNGKKDIKEVALITNYKGHSSLSYWNDAYCDMINGTDAASFPPFINKKKLLYFFSSEICRSIYGVFEKEYILKGIKLYRFIVPKSAFDSPTINPDNHCYCTEIVLSRNCTAAGVLDLRACQGGKPIFLSLPHFLHGSDFLVEQVTGLSPSKEEHETYVDVEPITGFTMHFAKRLQVNVMFQPTDKIEILAKLKSEFVFPVLWLNETALIGDDSVNQFKSSVTVPLKVLEVLRIVLICLGVVVFLACSITLCVKKKTINMTGMQNSKKKMKDGSVAGTYFAVTVMFGCLSRLRFLVSFRAQLYSTSKNPGKRPSFEIKLIVDVAVAKVLRLIK
ncbi:PREDICTED: platelet glycoprotein 4 [Nanorana parkeri]|uniref:platelet glycoprotein 4 n=1 Tax=Nanorana parkeri TaxID=125878 RepID=UPI0008547BDD|nr:PREDICTED: platelet glycoprotein 4 [Nanorana parkeri]